MLCSVGDLVDDIVVHLPGRPARGTDTPAVISRSPGGSAANVAAAAAIAGAPVRFVGRVGDDGAGRALAAGLAALGVDVRVQRVGRTGTVVVLVEPGGERTMLPDRGAAQQLASVEPTWLDGVRRVHVPAYSLCAEPIGTSTVELVRRARERGAAVSVDVSSVAVVASFGVDRFRELVAACGPDIVFANAAEAALVGRTGAALTVVKDGPRPLELRTVAGTSRTVDVVAIAAADVVDTTGAGDAFAGGFLAATMAGASPVEAARRGAAMAARTLGVAGARPAPE